MMAKFSVFILFSSVFPMTGLIKGKICSRQVGEGIEQPLIDESSTLGYDEVCLSRKSERDRVCRDKWTCETQELQSIRAPEKFTSNGTLAESTDVSENVREDCRERFRREKHFPDDLLIKLNRLEQRKKQPQIDIDDEEDAPIDNCDEDGSCPDEGIYGMERMSPEQRHVRRMDRLLRLSGIDYSITCNGSYSCRYNCNKRMFRKNKSGQDKDIASIWDRYVLGMEGDHTPNNNIGDKIVGGKLIAVEEVPYLVVLMRYERDICGGTLITLQHVLTAAHCISAMRRHGKGYTALRPSGFSIRYGSNFSEYGGEIIDAAYFFIHPKYLKKHMYNIYMDLAIILLKEKTKINMKDVAMLPTYPNSESKLREMIRKDKECTVAGWGKTRRPQSLKRSLLVGTKLNLIDTDACAIIFGKHGYGLSDDAHICTYAEGTDACSGDSGGGLYCDGEVWGVTSWGIGCAEKGIPGVFARVDSNMDFIYKSIGSNPLVKSRQGGASGSSRHFKAALIYFEISTVLIAIKLW